MEIPPDLSTRVTTLEENFPDVPPIFHQLFALLPEPGADFPHDIRVEFLRAAASIFQLILMHS